VQLYSLSVASINVGLCCTFYSDEQNLTTKLESYIHTNLVTCTPIVKYVKQLG